MQVPVNRVLLVWALIATMFLLMGLTIPHTFTAGTTISASEMNANFTAIKASIDALEAASTAHEAAISALQTATSPSTQGNLLGYAFVDLDGTVVTSWMADGGTPTVTGNGASPGWYEITWPGKSVLQSDTPALVTCVAEPTMPRSAFWDTFDFGNGPVMRVHCMDGDGGPASSPFWVLIWQNDNP